MSDVMWRESEVAFVWEHPNADEIIAEQRTGRVIGAFYWSPYGLSREDFRRVLAEAERNFVPEKKEGA